MGNENLYGKLNGFWKMLDDMAENNQEVRFACSHGVGIQAIH